jgi:tetratricopeptide (TPR) repeat protein
MDEREARRRSYPLTIPDALLRSEAMQRACAARDFPEVFRLVNRRTGSSYADMAAAVGKMTSARLSDIIRGVRGIRGQGVIERVCDGFGIPGEMLGVPERAWEKGSPDSSNSEQSPTYADPSHEVTEDGSSSGSDVLLVPVLIEGRRQVMAVSRRELLAGAGAAAMPSMAAAPVAPIPQHLPLPNLDGTRVAAAVDHLKDMWHALVKADNLFGPRHALISLQQQLSIIDSLLGCSRGVQRLEILRLAAQYAESASWLYEDSADMKSAARWASQAMEWAIEAGDQVMVTWTLFRRSQQATTTGNAAQAIGLAQAAQRNEAALTAPMRAAAMQQEAHGYALDGEEISCHRRLDEAHTFAASPDAKGDARSGHRDFCTPSYIEARRGNCWLDLLRPDLAIPVFQTALAGLPDVYQRDRGFTQARLALAYVGVQEYEEAANQAASALSVARSSGSLRTLSEAVSAVNAIGAVHNSPAVSDLFDTIKDNPGF